MIDKEKEKIALIAIQDLLVKGRQLSFEGIVGQEMFNYFDELHYLPYLIYDDENQTLFFESYLKGICERYRCMEVWNRYLKRCSG